MRWIREEEKQTGREKKRKMDRERERERRDKKGRFSRRFDGRSLTVQEEKSIYASRATRGYQNLGVSSRSTR